MLLIRNMLLSLKGIGFLCNEEKYIWYLTEYDTIEMIPFMKYAKVQLSNLCFYTKLHVHIVGPKFCCNLARLDHWAICFMHIFKRHIGLNPETTGLFKIVALVYRAVCCKRNT